MGNFFAKMLEKLRPRGLFIDLNDQCVIFGDFDEKSSGYILDRSIFHSPFPL